MQIFVMPRHKPGKSSVQEENKTALIRIRLCKQTEFHGVKCSYGKCSRLVERIHLLHHYKYFDKASRRVFVLVWPVQRFSSRLVR